jgi:hypothetical protein
VQLQRAARGPQLCDAAQIGYVDVGRERGMQGFARRFVPQQGCRQIRLDSDLSRVDASRSVRFAERPLRGQRRDSEAGDCRCLRVDRVRARDGSLRRLPSVDACGQTHVGRRCGGAEQPRVDVRECEVRRQRRNRLELDVGARHGRALAGADIGVDVQARQSAFGADGGAERFSPRDLRREPLQVHGLGARDADSSADALAIQRCLRQSRNSPDRSVERRSGVEPGRGRAGNHEGCSQRARRIEVAGQRAADEPSAVDDDACAARGNRQITFHAAQLGIQHWQGGETAVEPGVPDLDVANQHVNGPARGLLLGLLGRGLESAHQRQVAAGIFAQHDVRVRQMQPFDIDEQRAVAEESAPGQAR